MQTPGCPVADLGSLRCLPGVPTCSVPAIEVSPARRSARRPPPFQTLPRAWSCKSLFPLSSPTPGGRRPSSHRHACPCFSLISVLTTVRHSPWHPLILLVLGLMWRPFFVNSFCYSESPLSRGLCGTLGHGELIRNTGRKDSRGE